MEVLLLLPVEGHQRAVGLPLRDDPELGHWVREVILVFSDVFFLDLKLLEMFVLLESVGREGGDEFPDGFAVVEGSASFAVLLGDVKVVLH